MFTYSPIAIYQDRIHLCKVLTFPAEPKSASVPVVEPTLTPAQLLRKRIRAAYYRVRVPVRQRHSKSTSPQVGMRYRNLFATFLLVLATHSIRLCCASCNDISTLIQFAPPPKLTWACLALELPNADVSPCHEHEMREEEGGRLPRQVCCLEHMKNYNVAPIMSFFVSLNQHCYVSDPVLPISARRGRRRRLRCTEE